MQNPALLVRTMEVCMCIMYVCARCFVVDGPRDGPALVAGAGSCRSRV